MRLALVVLAVTAASALAGQTLVRVSAQDYQELYDYIPFKGTSISIAGKVAGESYDLILDRADLPAVQASGLAVRVLIDDWDTYKDEFGQFAFYCSYDSLVGIMRGWAADYPTLCRLDSIGQTYLGRWIYAVKISDNVNVEEDEPEVLLEALHHSREWATPQAARHFCDTLLSNYATDPSFQEFVDNHQTWVVPSINVDGYDYDYPSQRMWRANRKPYDSEIGCDCNRNYPGGVDTCRFNQWGALVRGSRSTHRPGDITFMGPYAFWADCDDATQSFFRKHTFVAHVSMHSYSELVIWPYATGVTAPDDAMLAGLGQGQASRMQRLSGGNYTAEQAHELYPTAGAATDWTYGWAHSIGGFPCMSYVYELGTTFYQNLSQVDAIEREAFDGAFYLFTHADSIVETLEGEVPPPVLAPLDSSATGSFALCWSPVRQEHNHPDRWEVEELSGLDIREDDFESGTDRWDLGGFTVSTAQAHSGTRSLFSGSGNNISTHMLTKVPYPVIAGDSLTFWAWYDLEYNYDVGVAEVSENGLEWFQLHERFTGNSSGWRRCAYPLEPWAGRSVYIRFRSMTDDNTLRTGMYIDDVHPVPAFAHRTVLDSAVTDTTYQVTVSSVGTYWYRVRGHNAVWDWNNHGPLEDVVVTGTGMAGESSPRHQTRLVSVGPNPAPGNATIRYSLARQGKATVELYDASGRLVRILVSATQPAGSSSVRWDGRDDTGREAAAGVYYCRLAFGNEASASRLVLTR
ncbi:MAG: immune inhibitor A [candidate division WOR-3 bacterium]|nr:MAG: immune inhibitor A [candidate division WOR-3 bacterium]